MRETAFRLSRFAFDESRYDSHLHFQETGSTTVLQPPFSGFPPVLMNEPPVFGASGFELTRSIRSKRLERNY